MCRFFSVILFIVSASAMDCEQEYCPIKGVHESRTYRFDYAKRDFYVTTEKKCDKPGLVCDDCKNVYECIPIRDDYVSEPLEECAGESTCLQTSTTAFCTTGPNPGCGNDVYTFICHHVGLFPDPFDCRKYHMCVPQETTEPQPAIEPIIEPTTEPTIEYATESTIESTTESITEPTAELTTESMNEPIAESSTEPTTESITETTIELITESTIEPTTEPTTEPIIESTTEQPTQTATEPTTSGTSKTQWVSIELYCADNGFYYDARTTLCRKKLVDNKCPVVAEPCTTLCQVGLILDNPALYFICLKLEDQERVYPHVFSCPKNEEYDLISHSCKDPTPKTGIGAGNKCLETGLLYDPDSCLSYYQCTKNASPIKRVCGSKMHFDHKENKCVDFTCADLDK